VIGRMTAGMAAAPLATTPAQVGTAVVAALDKGHDQVWVPASLAALAAVIRIIPRPLWRRVKR
jgi:decaprenylphospho-beta-D-erythro-pentofuranosid-2-ulose 2-reductase